MDIAVFLPNWVGDAVMATPALRAIREHYGSGDQVVGIMRPALIELMAGTDWLDQSWSFDPRSDDPDINSGGLLRRMREHGFDTAVMMSNSLRCAMICYRAGVRDRIGYVGNCRSPLLTSRLYWTRNLGRRVPLPNVDMYLRLLEPIGCVCPSRKLELRTSASDRDAGDLIWQDLNLDPSNRVISINPGGAYGPSKIWPETHFAELARRIVTELDHDVLVLCGPNERDVARRIVAKAGIPRVVSMADQELVWGSVKAVIERCRMMVATDSGPRHIGAAFGLPVVTLLGPTVTTWIENPTVRAAYVMNDELECLGCYERECPLGHHRCMADLSADSVFTEVRRMFETL